MSSNMPMEALLRPPVEYYSSVMMASAAAFMAAFPERLLMLPSLAYPAAGVLAAFSFMRFRQATRVRRYQRGLRRVPYWEMDPKTIPLSNRNLYLGKGFRWTAVHTQRFYDAMKPANQIYVEPGKLHNWARNFENRHEKSGLFKGLIELLGKPFLFDVAGIRIENPFAPLPPVGGYSALHGVGMLEQEQAILQALGERVGHTFVAGTTRVGKTRLAEVLINQDIRRGDCVITIDPKGDGELLRSMYIAAKEAGRLHQFYVLHLGHPKHSCRYNPVGDFTRITEVSTRIARQLPGEGQSATFREFVWGYVNGIAKAMAAIGMRPDYRSIERYSNNLEPLVVLFLEHLIRKAAADGEVVIQTSFWEDLRVFANAKDPNDEKKWMLRVPMNMMDRDRYSVALVQFCQGALAKHFGQAKNMLKGSSGESLIFLFEYDPKYYQKLVASLLPFLAKLTTGRIAEIIAPDYNDFADPRPILEWMSFIRQNGIIYVGLDALSDPDVAAVVGSTMFSDLVSTLGRVYKHGYHEGLEKDGPIKRDVRLHADEFSDLIREDFIPLLNKGGGAGSIDKGGFSATVYTQTLSDIVARLGNTAKAGQTIGNLNTIAMLRVKEQATAELLTKQLGKVPILDSMLVTSTSDVPDQGSTTMFRSSAEQRITSKEVPLIDVDHVMKLPKGQAFVLKDGGQLFKLRLPLSKPSHTEIPAHIEAMVSDMKSTYNSDAADEWARWTPIWQKIKVDDVPVALDNDGMPMPVLEPGRVDPFAEMTFDPAIVPVPHDLAVDAALDS